MRRASTPAAWIILGCWLPCASAAPGVGAEDAGEGPTPVELGHGTKSFYEGGYEHVRRGDFDRAIECFSQGLSIDPASEDLLIARADALMQKGALQTASVELSRTISLHPTSALAYRARGICKMRQSLPNAAIDDFDRAIALDPRDNVAFYRRARIWRSLGKNDASLKDLDASIAIERSEIVIKARSQLRYELQDLDGAIEDLDTLIEMQPADADAFQARGIVKHKRGLFDEAIEDFTAAIKLQPNQFMHYLARSLSYQSLGSTDEEVQDLDKAVELAEKNTTALMYRAHSRLKRLEIAGALGDYDAVIEIDPSNDLAEARIGLILATCPIDDVRDGDEAVKHANKACGLTKWHQYAAISTLAAAYAEKGDFAKATDLQSRAIELAPTEEKNEMRGVLQKIMDHQPLRGMSPALKISD